MTAVTVRPTTRSDASRVSSYLADHWGSDVAVVHGVLFHPSQLPGHVAVDGDEWVGLLTYHIAGNGCEIVTLNSDRSGLGIGTALIEAARTTAVAAGCIRLWVVTTNDNWPAQRFYQKRGFHLAALRINAVEESRALKPEIPATGIDGIPIRDELEFDMLLSARESTTDRQARDGSEKS